MANDNLTFVWRMIRKTVEALSFSISLRIWMVYANRADSAPKTFYCPRLQPIIEA
jgi:hypothetical protein